MTLTPQDLTASYTNAAPPAAPRNTPFANFITGVRENLTHILWNGLNSKWVFREMEQAPQNVSCLAFCQASLAIVGNATICASGVTYSIGGLPPGTNVSWKLTTQANATATTSNGFAPTFTTAFAGTGSSGPGVLTAFIGGECGYVEAMKQVYIGPPALVELQEDLEASDPCAKITWYSILNYDPTLTYSGTGLAGRVGDGRFRVKGRPGSSRAAFTINVTNACGSVSTSSSASFPDCDYGYAAYPNPANDQLTVEQTDGTGTPRTPAARGTAATASSSAAPGPPYTVRLFDSYGAQQAQQATTTPTLSLPTSALPTGLYLLHIEVDGAVVERRRLQITH